MDELEKHRAEIERLCLRLGADAGQVSLFAAQLIKRARQVADERGCSRTEALDQLLRTIIRGREGRSCGDTTE